MDELELIAQLAIAGPVPQKALRQAKRALFDAIEAPAEGRGQTVVPYLIYDDVERAIGWLNAAFGFTELPESRMVDEAGMLGHAEVEAAGMVVTLGVPSVHGASPRSGVSSMISVRVDGPSGTGSEISVNCCGVSVCKNV